MLFVNPLDPTYTGKYYSHLALCPSWIKSSYYRGVFFLIFFWSWPVRGSPQQVQCVQYLYLACQMVFLVCLFLGYIPSSSWPSLASKYLVLPTFVLCLKVLCYWSFIELSFPICSFIGSACYHFVLILFGTSLFGPSLYCTLSFSYSTTWSYKLFVLVLFWTFYFGPFSFCRLLFLSFNTLSCLFFGLSLLSPSQVCPFSFRPSFNVENACTFDADDAWLQALWVFFFFCIAAHIILLARFNSCVINIHFV